MLVRLGMAVLMLAILSGCGVGTVTPKPGPSVDVRTPVLFDPLQLQPGQIIVAFPSNSDVPAQQLSQRLVDDYDIVLSRLWPLTSIGVDCAVYDVTNPSEIDRIVRAINQEPSVTIAVKNQRFEALGSEYNDPYASYQNNVAAIGAELVHHWSTGKNVKVAVIDTGMDTTHQDFSTRVVEKANFVQGGDESFSKDQHGTAVAGIIAAGANDGVGIFGVAPGAEILASKACWYPVNANSKAVCSSWTIARAIDHAINSGAQIINLSLGGPADDLIEYLLETAFQRGIVTVAAAGKLNTNQPMFPASLPTTIAVVTGDDGDGDFSNWSDVGLIVSAPGSEILTTTPDQNYNFLSGSSLATAHVTGAVALLLERQPILPRQVFQLLQVSMRSASSNGNFLNICAAMNKLEMSNICS